MILDIRYPIGLLFSVIGAMLLAEGVFGSVAPAAAAGNLNVDAWWGLVMLAFGAGMLIFARRRGRRSGRA